MGLHIIYGLLLTPFVLRRTHPELIAQHWFRGLAGILGLRIQTTGRAEPGPLLLVGNHISWVDIIALCATTPVLFVSKAEVRNWPIVGLLTRAAKTLFIERGAHGTADLRQQMLDCFAHQHRIAIFPEGTTTDGTATRRFQPRLFAVAIDGNIPVQAFALHYRQDCVAYIDGGPSLFGVLWQCVAQPHIDVFVHFGPTLDPADRRDAYAVAAQTWVSAELGALHENHPRRES